MCACAHEDFQCSRYLFRKFCVPCVMACTFAACTHNLVLCFMIISRAVGLSLSFFWQPKEDLEHSLQFHFTMCRAQCAVELNPHLPCIRFAISPSLYKCIEKLQQSGPLGTIMFHFVPNPGVTWFINQTSIEPHPSRFVVEVVSLV